MQLHWLPVATLKYLPQVTGAAIAVEEAVAALPPSPVPERVVAEVLRMMAAEVEALLLSCQPLYHPPAPSG